MLSVESIKLYNPTFQKAKRNAKINSDEKAYGKHQDKVAPCLVALSTLAITALVAPRIFGKTFDKKLAQLGLAKNSDGLLINKNTGAKFTGEIKNFTGKERVTRKFNNGVLSEELHKGILGGEKEAVFNNGNKKVVIGITRNPIFPFSKSASIALSDGKTTTIIDKKTSSNPFKSFFEEAKNFEHNISQA
ncbi:MAG: hypothetical protein MJ237_07745 [bacterium]|nr:hypothetical protein [bacterium]